MSKEIGGAITSLALGETERAGIGPIDAFLTDEQKEQRRGAQELITLAMSACILHYGEDVAILGAVDAIDEAKRKRMLRRMGLTEVKSSNGQNS